MLVQRIEPVPGRVYSLLFVAVMNGDPGQTFTAANGFKVRLPGYTGSHRVVDHAFPILTGDQVWKPKTWIVFYAPSKKYYPLSPQISAGFQLDAGGRSLTARARAVGHLPADHLRSRQIRSPARLDRRLWPGCELGAGVALGLPDTAINILVSANTERQDFAGHF